MPSLQQLPPLPEDDDLLDEGQAFREITVGFRRARTYANRTATSMFRNLNDGLDYDLLVERERYKQRRVN